MAAIFILRIPGDFVKRLPYIVIDSSHFCELVLTRKAENVTIGHSTQPFRRAVLLVPSRCVGGTSRLL